VRFAMRRSCSGARFLIIYFGAPFVYLASGTVSSPRYVVSLPYTVQVTHMNLESWRSRSGRRRHRRGGFTGAGQHRRNLYGSRWRTSPAYAELRIKARVAQESLEASRSISFVTRKQ